MNNDGRCDFVVSDDSSVALNIVLGTDVCGFGTGMVYNTLGPSAVAVSDFNGDGKKDLAIANNHWYPNYVTVMNGDGKGHFAAPASYSAGAARRVG